MSKLIETLQSRKFWLSILVMGLAVGLFMGDQIDVDRMVDIVRWAAGVYVGALSLEDAIKQLLPITAEFRK